MYYDMYLALSVKNQITYKLQNILSKKTFDVKEPVLYRSFKLAFKSISSLIEKTKTVFLDCIV